VELASGVAAWTEVAATTIRMGIKYGRIGLAFWTALRMRCSFDPNSLWRLRQDRPRLKSSERRMAPSDLVLTLAALYLSGDFLARKSSRRGLYLAYYETVLLSARRARDVIM
jgi:hypothetical protein